MGRRSKDSEALDWGGRRSVESCQKLYVISFRPKVVQLLASLLHSIERARLQVWTLQLGSQARNVSRAEVLQVDVHFQISFHAMLAMVFKENASKGLNTACCLPKFIL